MAYEKVASGGIFDLGVLSSYESYLSEGDQGLLELDLRTSVSQSIVSQLENQLKQAGVEDARVTTGSPKLKIYFKKGFPWLAIIVAIVLGLVVLAVLIVGWNLFKLVPDPLKIPAAGAVVILVLLAGLFIARRL